MNFQRELSDAHIAAVKRRRRVIVQYDAFGDDGFPPLMGMDIKKWIDYRFNYEDQPGSQIESIFWDAQLTDQRPVYPSKYFPPCEIKGIQKWQSAGIDIVQVMVEESHKRNLEAFWHHRISTTEEFLSDPLWSSSSAEESKKILSERGLNWVMEQTPLKKAHPDWVIRSWYWPGLWNLAEPAVWDLKLKMLREPAENYGFDGIQIDFSRHVPCLPPGRQWELRDCVTEFMRRVRRMLLDIAKDKKRPILLSAKVPETLEGCRIDGFDVETWADENIVDMFTLGSRSMNVDVAAFRRITMDRNIKLYPCFDDHHATDAYRHQPIEFLRGVFSNWWQQGADGVETFNWANASKEGEKAAGRGEGRQIHPPVPQHGAAYREIGDPSAMKFKDKIFAIERRWGYPWSEGYFGQNRLAPLPLLLSNDGIASELAIMISDDIAEAVKCGKFKEAFLRLVLFKMFPPDDRLDVSLNGQELAVPVSDDTWKDSLIFSPKDQPPSGGDYPIDPGQKLLMLQYKLSPDLIRTGENHISLRTANRGQYPLDGASQIKVEKVEAHLSYT